jgi:NAD+ synthase
MIHLFDLAAAKNALVVGTENKSELELGYYTLWGDQASSVELFNHLYKTQIYQLAHALDIPQPIIDQAPSANLWPGQTDEAELGLTYAQIDQVLSGHTTNLSPEIVAQVRARVQSQKFKRQLPYVVAAQ